MALRDIKPGMTIWGPDDARLKVTRVDDKAGEVILRSPISNMRQVMKRAELVAWAAQSTRRQEQFPSVDHPFDPEELVAVTRERDEAEARWLESIGFAGDGAAAKLSI